MTQGLPEGTVTILFAATHVDVAEAQRLFAVREQD